MDIATCTTPPRPVGQVASPAGPNQLISIDWEALAAHAAPAKGYVISFAGAAEPLRSPAA